MDDKPKRRRRKTENAITVLITCEAIARGLEDAIGIKALAESELGHLDPVTVSISKDGVEFPV